VVGLPATTQQGDRQMDTPLLIERPWKNPLGPYSDIIVN
jgi:hypothetical protein